MEIITTNYQFFQYELVLDEFKNNEPSFFQEIEDIKKQKKVEVSEESTIHKFNKSINEEIVKKNIFLTFFSRKKMKKVIFCILEDIGVR
jgi:hypothetical protein